MIASLRAIQFDVTNTLNDQLLEDVRVEVEESEGWSILANIPIPILPYDHPATTYTLLEMEDASIGLYGIVLHWDSVGCVVCNPYSDWDISQHTEVQCQGL